MAIADPVVMPLARELLECYEQEIGKVLDPPTYMSLRPGTVVDHLLSTSHDECCEGLAWVRPGSFYPSSGSFPLQDQVSVKSANGGALAWAITLELGSIRCAPTHGPNAIPTTAEWDATTQAVMDDAAAMRRAICCFIDANPRRKGLVLPGIWQPIAVEGGCVGGVLPVTVMGPACDCQDAGPPDPINVLADPSAFGWPDETNTGTTGELTPVAGGMDIVTEGQVIENLNIDGIAQGYGMFINANNVTVRNCRIITTPGPGGGGIVIAAGRTGIMIEDCELTYDAPGTYAAVIGTGEASTTIRRCYIHHVSEGPRLGPDCTLIDSYITTLLVDDPDAHADAVQCTGAPNVRVSDNTIVASQEGADFANAAGIFGCEFADSPNLQVTGNLLDGGGFTLFAGGNPPTFFMANPVFTGNRFGRTFAFGPTSFGAGITGLVWTGNVWDDDNTAVPEPELP